jgi:hypothetical protein
MPTEMPSAAPRRAYARPMLERRDALAAITAGGTISVIADAPPPA